jgi:nucleoside-diphosphate-sugar epimerase
MSAYGCKESMRVNVTKVSDMTTKHNHGNPILVTGAAGAVGGIGRNLTEFLLAKGHRVRALVRREDECSEALRRLGAEVVQGDLTDLASMHRAIEGCGDEPDSHKRSPGR